MRRRSCSAATSLFDFGTVKILAHFASAEKVGVAVPSGKTARGFGMIASGMLAQARDWPLGRKNGHCLESESPRDRFW